MILSKWKPASLPKRETLGEEFTDADYRELCAKLTRQHEQFRNHQIRDVSSKVKSLKSTFNRLTTEEIFTALKNSDYNEDEVTILLTKSEFIAQIRNEIAQMRHRSHGTQNTINESTADEKIEPEDEEIEAEDEELDSFDSDTTDNETFSHPATSTINKRKQPQSSKLRSSRLRLDDALANASDMEGWSEARIRAYQSMKTNPNTYFYRFNAPGETQRNGPWSKEEDDLFMKRLAEVGADGQWGIFSMSIPGRVGYQVHSNDIWMV